MRRSPSSTARVRLPTAASVCTSRRLLATSRAQASRPMPTAAPTAGQREPLGLHVGGAEHGDQAEEHEDEDLAEPGVAVGLRAAGVEPGGARRRRRRPGAATRRSARPGPARPARRRRSNAKAASLTAAGAASPAPTSRVGPDPVGVRAADAVGVVVGVVDADLQGQRHQQRQRRRAARRTRRARCRRRSRPGRAPRRRAASGDERPRSMRTGLQRSAGTMTLRKP